MYKSIKVAAGWVLASPWGSVLPITPVQRSWGWPEGQTDSSPGQEQSCSPSRSVPRDRRVGVYPGAMVPSGSVAFEHVCILPLCPPFESVHAGVGS